MLSEKDYCDYETCVALKELGYIGQGRHFYDLDNDPKELRHFGIQVLTTRSAEALNFVLAIRLYDAQKWLREEHNLHIEVCYNPSISWYYYHVWKDQDEIAEGDAFPSYEDALSTAIYMAVECLKKDSNGN